MLFIPHRTRVSPGIARVRAFSGSRERGREGERGSIRPFAFPTSLLFFPLCFPRHILLPRSIGRSPTGTRHRSPPSPHIGKVSPANFRCFASFFSYCLSSTARPPPPLLLLLLLPSSLPHVLPYPPHRLRRTAILFSRECARYF